MAEESKIKPLLILPVGEITKRDIKRLNENGFCVVEAKDPSKIRFMEPPPGNYNEQERAAIDLFRVLMDKRDNWNHNRASLATLYVDLLMVGRRPETVKPVAKVAK